MSVNENVIPKSSTNTGIEKSMISPPVDVYEDREGIILFADMPGVSKENLNLNVEAGTLTIEGDLAVKFPQDMEARHAEVNLPGYKRVFTLSNELDANKISAEFNQGVLKLTIPKAEHAQPRKIEISVN